MMGEEVNQNTSMIGHQDAGKENEGPYSLDAPRDKDRMEENLIRDSDEMNDDTKDDLEVHLEDDEDATSIEAVEEDQDNSLSLKESMGDLASPILSRFDSPHFEKACKIIRAIREPEKRLERPMFEDDNERILCYELTIAILKYSTFISEVLERSRIFKRYNISQSKTLDELMVVTYDLLERDFRTHTDDPKLSETFAPLKSAVLQSKTKVMAHLARLRIKHGANTLNHLLPEDIRHQNHIDKNPLYIWVNLKKAKLSEIVARLTSMGLKQTEYEDDLLIQETSFSVDERHPDLIRLHSSQLKRIQSSSLVKYGKIVIQDKSACLSVYALVNALYFSEKAKHELQKLIKIFDKRNRMTNWYDEIFDPPTPKDCVIVTHGGACRSVAHLAALLLEAVPKFLSTNAEISKEKNLAKAIQQKYVARPPLSVVAFGIPFYKHLEISKYFRKIVGLNNVKLFSDQFCQVEPSDPRVKGACAILVNPPSSGSGLKDPVAYICNEGGDEEVLLHMSSFVKNKIYNEANKYTLLQTKALKHAIKFPQIKLIMYSVCSVLDSETTDVVNNCIKIARAQEDLKRISVLKNITKKRNRRSYREISLHPVSLMQILNGYPSEYFKTGFLQIQPNSAFSGVYISLIRKWERMISIGKTPLKSFVSAQLNFINDSKDRKEEFENETGENITVPSTSENFRKDMASFSGTSLYENFVAYEEGKMNEEELNKYLYNKFGPPEEPIVEKKAERTYLAVSSREPSRPGLAPTVLSMNSHLSEFGWEKNKRIVNRTRRISKNALVKRIAIPTYASMAKTKRRHSDTPKMAEEYQSVRPHESGFRPISNAATEHFYLAEHSVAPCYRAHSAGISWEHYTLCTRHAKKFPDFAATVASKK